MTIGYTAVDEDGEPKGGVPAGVMAEVAVSQHVLLQAGVSGSIIGLNQIKINFSSQFY